MDASARIGLKAFVILLHAVSALFLHTRCGMRIGAEREGHSGMTEVFLHSLDVVPGAEASQDHHFKWWFENNITPPY